MSLKVIKTILENPGCVGTTMQYALLMVMASHAHDDGMGIFASIRTMAKECHMSERWAWVQLKALLGSGVVIDTGKKHDCGNGHWTVVYAIDQSAVTALCESTECTYCTQQSASSAPSRVHSVHPQSASSADESVLMNQSMNQSGKQSLPKAAPLTSKSKAGKAKPAEYGDGSAGLKPACWDDLKPPDRKTWALMVNQGAVICAYCAGLTTPPKTPKVCPSCDGLGVVFPDVSSAAFSLDEDDL